jgi:enhancing lycopene biosynthesis protein 2
MRGRVGCGNVVLHMRGMRDESDAVTKRYDEKNKIEQMNEEGAKCPIDSEVVDFREGVKKKAEYWSVKVVAMASKG